MASKSCVFTILKTIRTSSLSVQQLSGFQCRSSPLLKLGFSRCPSPTVLATASLHSLPGYRHSLEIRKPSNLTFVRGESTKKADNHVSQRLGHAGIAEQDAEDFTTLDDHAVTQAISNQINTTLEKGDQGRLYAVVYVRGMQHKVTAEDVIQVKFDFPPDIGDRLRLEKVLCVGGKDFSLLGQPMLGRDIVKVEATVVEKTLSHNRVWFMTHKRRGRWRRMHIYKEGFTCLVINSIQMTPLPEVMEDHTREADIM